MEFTNGFLLINIFIPSLIFENLELLKEYLFEFPEQNAAILIKVSRRVKLEKVAHINNQNNLS